MPRSTEVFARVLARRGIATTHVPAAQAQSEVNPPGACLQTFFTTFRGWFHIANLIEMSTLFHFKLPSRAEQEFRKRPLRICPLFDNGKSCRMRHIDQFVDLKLV